jgi:hypothetical protein
MKRRGFLGMLAALAAAPVAAARAVDPDVITFRGVKILSDEAMDAYLDWPQRYVGSFKVGEIARLVAPRRHGKSLLSARIAETVRYYSGDQW